MSDSAGSPKRQRCVDLRSDTVTKPSSAMRAAMAAAEVGDDVYGEDPTVNRLESACATLLGLEAGLFVPSGTQSNLAALLTHCGRGDEYIAGQDAHTYRFEGGGAAAFGGIQPQPLPFRENGTLDLDDIAAAIKPDDDHFAKTRLICLENTQGGKAVDPAYFAGVRRFADQHGLKVHLDGARLFNAVVALRCLPRDFGQACDSVSVCLSKGLGAPAGSVLCGSASFVKAARRWRKVLGGGMRQAGVLAAAGLHALTNHVERLGDDHRRAEVLAQDLRTKGLVAEQRTNMVFVGGVDTTAMVEHMGRAGVRVSGSRWVVHMDIDDDDIRHVVQVASTLS
ncbi:MAG: low-specificity L-threonine aldolase [Gammaproteobacteria bacterium]|nr:low-specificity L-threonine aldolase [Gammaproteobacteria bacterium]MYF29124.1 low-specificity L-threonine aldolase [Gammaproteobacteria bacterium]MYK48293.1 low-specificity L-threonine aldolase [Gammaproteobacteria bacterium]